VKSIKVTVMSKKKVVSFSGVTPENWEMATVMSKKGPQFFQEKIRETP